MQTNRGFELRRQHCDGYESGVWVMVMSSKKIIMSTRVRNAGTPLARSLVTVFLLMTGSLLAFPVPVRALSCAGGGPCKVGDTGPGGGVVIHVATSPQWWGRYIEARALSRGRGLPWSLAPTTAVYVDDATGTAQRQRIDARAIGMGAPNTERIIAQSGPGKYAASYVDSLVAGGFDDWYLPSLDELDAAYHQVIAGRLRSLVREAYWTSTEASDRYAWYQMFQDGTQFTDENSIGQVNGVGVVSNKNRVKNARHGMSGFPARPYRLMAVRYFGSARGSQPPVSSPALTGNTCTDDGPCEVGDIGPGGGVVFYDAGRHQTWGRYLEAAPSSTEAVGLTWERARTRVRTVYQSLPWARQQPQRAKAKLLGMGESNTRTIVRTYGPGQYAARYAASLVVNGKDDWFLPSHDELTLMYTVMQTANTPMDPLKRSFYWSSSEYDLNNSWTVNFKDGQMFDRLKDTVPTESIKAIRVRAIRAFG